MAGEEGLSNMSYGMPYMSTKKKTVGNQFNYSSQNNTATDMIKDQAAKMAEEQASNAAKMAAENAAKNATANSWYNNLSNPFEGLGDKFGSWFTPQGTSGTSLAGGVLSGLGTLTNIGTGLAGMRLAKAESKYNRDMQDKTYARDTARQALMDKMQVDAYNRSVQRENEGEARGAKFAENAGNGAFYK